MTLQRWTLPKHYAGEQWLESFLAGIGQSRDSDALERSNFVTMLKALGGESETVTVVREGHWAVGWIEWIAIHESDVAAQAEAERQLARLEDYPVLDEDHYSELEWTEAADYWDGLSPRDKVQHAMDARKRYHWLGKESVWRFGRMDYCALANDGGTIAEAIYESLRS